jgi:putative phosphoesterase
MKIGVLSDTHNNIPNLLKALSVFKDEGITQLLHCGDMADMLTARQMGGFDVIYVNGNSDRTAEAVSHTVWTLNPQNEIPGDVFTGEFDGVKIGATHGHLAGKLKKLIKSRSIKYVFHGHTHRKRDEMIGVTRVINPGALGGARYEPRTVCIVDFAKSEVRFLPVSNW